MSTLNPKKTILDTISLPLKIHNVVNKNQITERVKKLLSYVGLEPEFMVRYPDTLSGGQKQRVAIARAVINEPQLILADEPTGNLDPVSSFDLIKLLEEINSEGTTVFMASHNYSLIKSRNHRIVEIHNGKLRSQ